jgi:autotransporter-associated beta strand protein
MHFFCHILSPKSALRLSLIITGLVCAFPTVTDAAKAGGGTTTTMVLTYAYGAPPRWVARIDPLNVRGFQLDINFNPDRAVLDQTVGQNGIIYKIPFVQGPVPPDFSMLAQGFIKDIAGSAMKTSPGDVDIFELVFLDTQPGQPIDGIAFTVFASSNDSIVGFDPVTMQTVVFDFTQIAPTTRMVTSGGSHVWDPDTLYNNGTTGGPGIWDTSSNSWDDLPSLTQPFTDTAWNNATHAGDIATFGGNPGSGTVTLAGSISAGGLQFDSSGYHLQGGTLTLSAPPGLTPVVDTGVNNALISSTIDGNRGLTKVGAGTLALTGANTYTGGTFVNAGTLLVAGGSGAGSGVQVNIGGTFGGVGAFGNPVNVGPSAAVLAGDGTSASGTLTLTNLTLNNGAIIKLALGPAGSHSTLNRAGVPGNFSPNQGFTILNFGAQTGVYDNVVTGVPFDPGVATWHINNPGFTATFMYDGGNIDMNLTAVPPPFALSNAGSSKSHGAAGTFIVPLPATSPFGVECRSAGAGGNHTFVFAFTNTVVSGSATLGTTGLGSISGSPVFAGNTMTVNLTGVSDVQLITVTLSGVTDSFAQVLLEFAVSAKFLLGDVNESSSVGASDIAFTKQQSGVGTVSGANFRADVTVNGAINAADIGLVKSKSGNTLP